MTDTISLTQWLAEQQGLAVAVFFLLVGALMLWRDWIVTGNRFQDVCRARDFWQTEYEKRERELESDRHWRTQMIDALWTLTEILEGPHTPSQARRWFDRWRP